MLPSSGYVDCTNFACYILYHSAWGPVVGKICGGGGDEAGALRVLLGPLGRKALGLESEISEKRN